MRSSWVQIPTTARDFSTKVQICYGPYVTAYSMCLEAVIQGYKDRCVRTTSQLERVPGFKMRGVMSPPERLRWSRGSVLAFGPQVRGFKPVRSRRIFQGEKILSTPSFGREVKPFVPCRRFTACNRSLNVTWKSGIFRQNSLATSRPSSSSFHY